MTWQAAFLLIGLLFNLSLRSQNNPYETVDSVMSAFKEKVRSPDDLYKVTYFIRTSFPEDSLRLRASCIWIAENIAYDVVAFLKGDPRAAQLSYVLKEKKAICSGYASLLKYFCDAFNIQCEVVSGYARALKSDIVLSQWKLPSNHAWNVVYINDKWRLIDPTWFSGSLDYSVEDKPKYVKDLKELYYFSDPDRMILNHFPKMVRHQLLEKPVSVFTFRRWPLFYSNYLQSGIMAVYPDSSILKLKKGDTLTIKFRFPDEPVYMTLRAYSDAFENSYYSSPLVKNGDYYEFRYPLSRSGYYILYIGRSVNSPMLAYKLEVN